LASSGCREVCRDNALDMVPGQMVADAEDPTEPAGSGCRRSSCGRLGTTFGTAMMQMALPQSGAGAQDLTGTAPLTHIHTPSYVSWCMARTNIDIDDVLVARVMRRYRLSTKKDAVDFALRALVGNPMTREEALALEGTGWHADLRELRDGERIEPL
jgi:Arc/MetJ family transcription regulator